MAKNLMIQGTMSGAGKSTITAGILRILLNDGYRVAPFKSQNMALNSFVTKDNKEMGRAQVVQAIAAGMEPSSDMNPILIKPMGDTTSQVIVNGEPIGNMKASEYYVMKNSLIPDIRAAYDRLSDEADIIVIEGAGSPVEINLRDNDIVNMGLAEIMDAPVLLVGNIDPGGVFAQLLGTVSLMTEEERARVKGLIINRFRGDKSLLMPGLQMFKEYCSIPFAGVVPYVKLDLDDEDSVSERLDNAFHTASESAKIKICVLRLPFISNHSDFTAFGSVPGADLIYAKDTADLEDADLIILPGTKNTLKDLLWLRESKMEQAVLDMAGKGALIIGICGGFQMLGEKVDDRDNNEGGGSLKGLSLLPLSTVFDSNKTLKQVTGQIGNIEGEYAGLSGADVNGYEIHMGVTEGDRDIFPAYINGNVLGTYIHGFFDSPDLMEKLIRIIYKRKGIEDDIKIEDHMLHTEKELDRLADVLRENLDMEMIYKILDL